GNAMCSELKQLLVKSLIIGGDHASFPCGDMLYRMERKDCQFSEFAAATVPVQVIIVHEKSTWGMTGILYDPEVILLGKFPQRFQIHCPSRKIHRNDSLIRPFGRGF